MVQADGLPAANAGAVTPPLVERLRSADPPASATTLMLQAADEIERLSRELAIANRGGLDLLYEIREAVGWNKMTGLSLLPDECKRLKEIERLRSQGGAPAWNDLPEEARTRLVNVGEQYSVAFHGGDAAVAMYKEVRKILSSLSAAPQPPVSQSVQPPEGGTGSPVVQIIPPSGLVEGPGWQVIETAPADGTEVILFYPHTTQDGFVTAGYYYRDGGDGPYWYADLVNGYASPPTHWQPLPSPPGQDARTNDGSETDGSLNQSALPRKDVEGAE